MACSWLVATCSAAIDMQETPAMNREIRVFISMCTYHCKLLKSFSSAGCQLEVGNSNLRTSASGRFRPVATDRSGSIAASRDRLQSLKLQTFGVSSTRTSAFQSGELTIPAHKRHSCLFGSGGSSQSGAAVHRSPFIINVESANDDFVSSRGFSLI